MGDAVGCLVVGVTVGILDGDEVGSFVGAMIRVIIIRIRNTNEQ